MFLVIKVNVPIEYGYFRVQKMSTTMVAWLRKIVDWNRLQWLEILLTFVGLADVSFHYNSFPL